MGIADQIKGKVKVIQGEPVGAFVERGEVEIGLQQIPEILAVSGIDYIGPLPADIQAITTFSFGVHSSTRHEDVSRAWMKLLTSPKSAAVARKYGLEPM